MVLKRQLKDREDKDKNKNKNEDDILSRESKRGLKFRNVGGDFLKGVTISELFDNLVPFLRNVVRDEVKRSIGLFNHQIFRPSLDQIETSRAAATFELHFVDKIPQTIFTVNKVESTEGKPIKIVICDAVSKNTITSGPLSSVKIEILVLDGDFGSDNQEDWSEDEFKANLLTEREGKQPLLTGKRRIALEDGLGYVSEVVFTDNSSWIRGRKFRLGARVVHGNHNGVRIREAKSEAFVVKDQRGESYKKHHPPTMEDDLWRLEKIAKDGAFHKRLASNGITTVGDFTRHYYVDPKYLRNVLGGGNSERTWEMIVKHATECVVDEKIHVYFNDTTMSLVFDSVFKSIGVIFNSQNYQPLDKLSDLQMGLFKSLKGQAYKNVNAWVPFDDMSAFGPTMASSSLNPDQYSSPSSATGQVFSGIQQDQLEMQSISTYTTQPSYADNVQDTAFIKTNYLSVPCADDYSQIGHLSTENSFPLSQSPWDMDTLFSSFGGGTTNVISQEFSTFSRSGGTPRGRWRMLKAALTWAISVRREIAAKKEKAKPFYIAP